MENEKVHLRLNSGPLGLVLFATCGGLGLIRFAPGTWTSLAAAIFWGVLGIGFNVPSWVLILLNLILLAVASPLLDLLERHTQTHDSSSITVDEWVGMGLAMGLASSSWKAIAVAFVLFRFFDIAKPLGIRRIDIMVTGGWGVMLDDVVAGVYAAIVLFALMFGLSYFGIYL